MADLIAIINAHPEFFAGLLLGPFISWFVNKGMDRANTRFWRWWGRDVAVSTAAEVEQAEGVISRAIGAVVSAVGLAFLAVTVGSITAAAMALLAAVALATAVILLWLALNVLWFTYKFVTDPEFRRRDDVREDVGRNEPTGPAPSKQIAEQMEPPPPPPPDKELMLAPASRSDQDPAEVRTAGARDLRDAGS